MSNALLALIAQRKAASSRGKTAKPPMGRSRWKLFLSWRNPTKAPSHLNPQEQAEWAAQFYADFGQHFLKDAAGQVKAVALCVDKTYGRPCTICDEVARGILASQDDLTKKRLEDAKANGRVLLNAVQMDGPNPNQVEILELAPSAFSGKKGVGGVLSLFQDWPNLLNWENGADIIIERAGQGKDTTYGVSAVPSTRNFAEAEFRPKLNDLDSYIAQENNESTQRALASVSAITGLLPAPSRPALTTAAAAAFAAAPATAAVKLDDVPDLASMAAVASAAPNPFVAAPPVAPVAMPTVAAPAPVAAPPQFTQEQLQAAMAMLQAQATAAAASVAPAAAPVAAPVVQTVQTVQPQGQSLEDMLKDL